MADHFDALNYLAANPDLARAFGLDTVAAAQHYATYGRTEGRSTTFDALSYISANADLIAAFGTNTVAAMQHYVTYGLNEGRSTAFDALGYLSANADLIAAFGLDTVAAAQHYITYGHTESRSTSFNASGYLAANADVSRSVGSDIDAARRHYILYGFREGRQVQVDGDKKDTAKTAAITTTTTPTTTTTDSGDLPADRTTPGRLSVGSRVTGIAETTGDRDWYAIDLEADTTYRFDGMVLGSTRVLVYDASGNRYPHDTVYDNDASPGPDLGVLVTPTAAGTYYVEISGEQPGSYSLSAIIGDDYLGDARTKGRLEDGDTISGTVNHAFDKDWFAMTLERGSTYRFETPRGTGPWIRLYDSAGYWVTTQRTSIHGLTSEEFVISATGTYYLELQKNRPGAYTVSRTRIATDPNFSDEVGASPGHASQLAMGATTSGNLSFYKDTDVFAVSLQQGHNYTFTVDSPILDNIRFQIHSPDDDDVYVRGTEENSLHVYDYTAVTTGTFFLYIDNGLRLNGTYAITAADNGMRDDYAGSTSTTGRLDVGDSLTGRIDYRQVDEYHSDSDWIAVPLEAGRTYGFTLQNNQAHAALSLRDGQGASLASTPYVDNAGNDGLQYTPTRSGTYFLDVSGENKGSASALGSYTLASRLLGGGSSAAMPLLALGG